jgi:hypothetical protein
VLVRFWYGFGTVVFFDRITVPRKIRGVPTCGTACWYGLVRFWYGFGTVLVRLSFL